MKKRALLSVYDKSNIVEFAKGLINLDYEIISTGGTYAQLKEHQIDVTPVEEVTLSKEILDGRVKTLHPKIHGAILAKRDNKNHVEELFAQDIQMIDLVCVNLYPFKETCVYHSSLDQILDMIDIGGNTLIRAAAKNYQDVIIVVDPNDYRRILEDLKNNHFSNDLKRKLAAKAYRLTASYDALIADFFTQKSQETFPERLTLTYDLKETLRYGENPHQKAAVYETPSIKGVSILNAEVLNGKTLSYNNIQDANAAIEILLEYREPTVVALKHMNPCGIGSGKDLFEAWTKAYQADRISIFGGIIATNQIINEDIAKKMSEIFLEIIIAPDYTQEALNILKKKKNLRLLKLDLDAKKQETTQIKSIHGGLLLQEENHLTLDLDNLTIPTKRIPTEAELKQLIFAYKAVKHVKSNATVLAKDSMTIGIGAGQMNRVGAADIAIKQAGKQSVGAVLASDAFFPMEDTVELASLAGITAIIQPGGSIRDQSSIDACDESGIAMVFTGIRHFKH